MSTGAFGPEARWQYTRVYRGFNQSSSSRSRRDFLILNLLGSSNLSSKVGPSETQGSLLEIPIQRGCLVSGKPDRNRKYNAYPSLHGQALSVSGIWRQRNLLFYCPSLLTNTQTHTPNNIAYNQNSSCHQHTRNFTICNSRQRRFLTSQYQHHRRRSLQPHHVQLPRSRCLRLSSGSRDSKPGRYCHMDRQWL